MSTLPNGSQKSVPSQDVAAWLRAAKERRAQLHLLAARSPWDSEPRQEAFVLMSDLLMEAFEEVRVVSESTRERSQTARSISTDLRVDCSRLKAQGALFMDRMTQFAPPPPEEIRKAESEMLARFKGEEAKSTS